jgi:hypothetical protein
MAARAVKSGRPREGAACSVQRIDDPNASAAAWLRSAAREVADHFASPEARTVAGLHETIRAARLAARSDPKFAAVAQVADALAAMLDHGTQADLEAVAAPARDFYARVVRSAGSVAIHNAEGRRVLHMARRATALGDAPPRHELLGDLFAVVQAHRARHGDTYPRLRAGACRWFAVEWRGLEIGPRPAREALGAALEAEVQRSRRLLHGPFDVFRGLVTGAIVASRGADYRDDGGRNVRELARDWTKGLTRKTGSVG